MKKTRKPLIVLAVITVLLLLLLAAVQALAPVVLNRKGVKGRIEALVSDKTGAKLTIERINLSIFPVLIAGVRGASISAPGKGEGSIQSLDVFPEFLPLIVGRLKVKAIRVIAPEFTVLLPRVSVQGETNAAAMTAFTDIIEGVLGPAFGPLIAGPGLALNIENGRLDLVKGGESSLLIRNVNARIIFSDAGPAPVHSSLQIFDDAYAGTPGRRFRLTATIDRLEADSPLLPGSVGLICKWLEVSNDRLSFTDLRIEAEKTALTLSGTVLEVQRKIDSLEVSVDGNVDPSVSRWIVGLSGLDRNVKILPSLKLEKVRVEIDENNDLISVQGNVTADGDVALAVDFSNSRAGLNVRKFVLKDRFSDAVMSLSVQNRVALIEFKGKIAKATLDRLLSLRQFPNGEVRGDFRARILLDQPGASTANGTLAGTNVVFPATLNLPISFERIDLNADNNMVSVEASMRSIGKSRKIFTRGTVGLSERDIRIDLDLSAGLLDLDMIRKLLPSGGNEGDKQTRVSSVPAVSGTIRVRAKEAVYRDYSIIPLNADIGLKRDGLRVELTKAVVCGVSADGHLSLYEGKADLGLNFSASNRPIQPMVRCAVSKDVRMTGTATLTGRVSSAAEPSRLLQNLHGNIKGTAVNGRIDYAKNFAKILDYLNVTEVFRGKFNDLRREGLDYNSLMVTAHFEKDQLVIDESVLDGTSVDMTASGTVDLGRKELDFIVLVSPIKTGNVLIQSLPIVRNIFGGTLVTIPLKMTGPFDDTTVAYHPVREIGSGLIGMMKRTVNAPFTLINPEKTNSGEAKTVR